MFFSVNDANLKLDPNMRKTVSKICRDEGAYCVTGVSGDEDITFGDDGETLNKCCTLVIGSILPESDVPIPTNWRKMIINIPRNEEFCFFSIDDNQEDDYEFQFLYDTDFIVAILETNVFECGIYIVETELRMVLYVNQSTVELRRSPRERFVIGTLMSTVYEITNQSLDDEAILSAKDINLEELYDKVISVRHLKASQQVDVDELRLIRLRMRMNKRLYPYQEEAMDWMMMREKPKCHSAIALKPPQLYSRVELNEKLSAYYNPYHNHLKFRLESAPRLSSGGLLCDEMGLGKTVEVLGCILIHKRPARNKVSPRNNVRRILDSSSSEDTSDCDEEISLAARLKALCTQPVIKRPARARIPIPQNKDTEQGTKNKDTQFDPPQELRASRRIPDMFVRKPSKPISGTRQLLQIWYEDKLGGLNESARLARTVDDESPSKRKKIEISCACGTDDTDMSNLIECTQCAVYQHSACFGFNSARQRDVQYLCPGCWKQQPLLKSGATLIVCPSRLLSQWQDEIRKHVHGKLRVFVYKGGSRSYPVYPTELQGYDIVLTTYNVLQMDLRLTDSNGKSLRQRARYCPPAASIANINWWRLVLDEAQLIESPGFSVSKMAKSLSAVHRWAITGTPIRKGMEDLLGIIDYLCMEPYTDPDIWYFKLMRPYLTGDEEPLLNFLAEVMWRTEKRHVENQINIPKQSFEVVWLDFSQIESYFYAREYEASKAIFLHKLNALNMPEHTALDDLPISALSNILTPVLTLRHACAHFSAVKGRYLARKKPLNSLQDLLDALLHKNSADFEDNVRIVVAAWNGIAGIHLLFEKTSEAVLQYKQVLSLKEKLREPANTMKAEIDSLQVIHALYNLTAILVESPQYIADSDNIDQLKAEYSSLEKHYIAKYDVEVLKYKQEFEEAANVVSEIVDEASFSDILEVYSIVDWIAGNNLYGKLVKMIENHNAIGDDRCLKRLKSEHHLELLSMLDAWQGNLSNARDSSIPAVAELMERDDNNEECVRIDKRIVEAAVACHLRKSSENAVQSGERPKCVMCITDKHLRDYENLLCNKEMKSFTSNAATSSGDLHPSLEEIVFQCISRLGLQQTNNAETKRKGQLQKQLFDGLRKELKAARSLWLKISYAVNSRDDLDNCKIRFGILTHDDADANPNHHQNNLVRNLAITHNDRLERIHLFNRNELSYQLLHLRNQSEIAVKEYERLLCTNLYLTTLRGKDENAGGVGRTLDPCPICRSDLEATFHMMPCGHCFCLNCMHILVQDAIRNTVACAVCRNRHNLKDINYLKITKDSNDGETLDGKELIKGNCSTKLEAAIRLVFKLRKQEPNVKVLIYSVWNAVLGILLKAMHENQISAVHMISDKQVDQFKDPTKNITALLLPIACGSKGLTLIEATHVLFLDPVLDKRDELQAISRVHRIGQTRPTVVHKFLMKDSIDESIYNVTNGNAAQSIGWKEVTIAHLKELYTHM